MRARSRRANRSTLGVVGVYAVAAFLASMALLLPMILVFATRSWADIDTCEAGNDGVLGWLVLGAILLGVAAVVLVPFVRAWRSRIELTSSRVTQRSLFSTSHVPLTRIAAISCPWRDPPFEWDGAPRSCHRELWLDGDARPLRLDAEQLSGDDGSALLAALDAMLVEERGAPDPAAPAYLDTERNPFRSFVPVLLGWSMVVAFVATMFVAALGVSERDLARRRTALAVADVIAVRHDQDVETSATVVFTHRDARVESVVARPGRAAIEVEDRVPIEFDPDDVCNVTFVDRPTPAAWLVHTLGWGSFAAFVASAVAFAAIVGVSVVRARAVVRRLSADGG